ALPVVANLHTANRAIQFGGLLSCYGSIGEWPRNYLCTTRRRWNYSKTGRRLAGKIDRCVLLAPTPTRVHPGIEPGPAINGRRYRRRYLRKSQPTGRKAESGPGKTGYELVAHWPEPPIQGLIRHLEPSLHGGNGQSNHAQKRKYPACVAL